MAKTIEEELLEMKGKVDRAKTEKAQLEGELKQAMSQLKDSHGVGSTEEAKKLIEKKEKKIQELDDQAMDLTQKLRKAYNWGDV